MHMRTIDQTSPWFLALTDKEKSDLLKALDKLEHAHNEYSAKAETMRNRGRSRLRQKAKLDKAIVSERGR